MIKISDEVHIEKLGIGHVLIHTACPGKEEDRRCGKFEADQIGHHTYCLKCYGDKKIYVWYCCEKPIPEEIIQKWKFIVNK